MDNIDYKIIPLEAKHIEWLREMRNKRLVWQNFSNAFLVNEIEQEDWFIKQARDKTKKYFSIVAKRGTLGDCLVGSVWMEEWDRINRSCRVGIAIHPDWQGRGIAFRMLGEFLKYLFGDLNLHRIWLLVMATNKPAQELYKKLGFKKEGIQKTAVFRGGKYIDYIMMAIIKEDK